MQRIAAAILAALGIVPLRDAAKVAGRFSLTLIAEARHLPKVMHFVV